MSAQWTTEEVAVIILQRPEDGTLRVLEKAMGRPVDSARDLRKRFPRRNPGGEVKWTKRNYEVMRVCVEKAGISRTARAFGVHRDAIIGVQRRKTGKTGFGLSPKRMTQKRVMEYFGISKFMLKRFIKEAGVALEMVGTRYDIAPYQLDAIERRVARYERIKERRGEIQE